MAKTLTLREVQVKFSRKFPDKVLIHYEKNYLPVVILCPKHGEVSYNNLYAALQSRCGCSKCVADTYSTVNSQAIRLLDTETQEIHDFPSVSAASRFIGCPVNTINGRLRGRTPFDRLIRYRYKLLPTTDDR